MLNYVAMLPVLIMLKNLLAYCIVENFRGKKLLGIMIFAEKTFAVCSLVLQMDTKPQKFLKKTIANNHKTPKFTKFFPSKFFTVQ